MNALRERPEIAHALQFIIRQFHVKMIFEPRQKIERLKAIDAEFFEKVIIGTQPLARYFEMLSRERKNLFSGFLVIRH